MTNSLTVANSHTALLAWEMAYITDFLSCFCKEHRTTVEEKLKQLNTHRLHVENGGL